MAIVIRNNTNITIQNMKQVRQGILWCKIKSKDNVFIIINIHAPNVKQAAFLSKLNEITANEKDRKHL